jgi:outer membrane murein-binding lipoprotein Lpp
MIFTSGKDVLKAVDALRRDILRAISDLTKEVKKLSNEINELRTEVTAEGEEDVLTAQTIADLNAKVDDLQAQLDQVQPLIDAAKAGEADALNQLEQVLIGVREATEELRADNPTTDGE